MMDCGSEGHKTAVIVLAAGPSYRFGSSKMAAPLCGKPLIRHAVDNALASDASLVVVVVNHSRSAASYALPERVMIAVNPNPSRGMSSSIVAGIQAVDDTICSFIVLAGDQPFVTSTMLNRLIGEHRLNNSAIVAYRFGDSVRNPVLFPHVMRSKLVKITGDNGARLVVKEHTAQAVFIDVEDDTELFDIDTESDLKSAEKLMTGRC